jgi:TIM-barrel protein
MFDPRLALASLSGVSDANWATAGADWAGSAFLGGICLDEPSRAAAREMVDTRDRDEFLPEDPFAFIDTQLSALSAVPIIPGFNVRSTTPQPVGRAATICAAHDAIVEINAHCRQDELRAAGCGETLLAATDRLVDFVRAAAETDAVVSVKVRAELPGVDLPTTAKRVAAAGADILHVDAMDSEAVIESIDAAVGDSLFVIANNGVRDRETAFEYLSYGADAVSVGRPSDRPSVLRDVRSAVETWFQEQPASSLPRASVRRSDR